MWGGREVVEVGGAVEGGGGWAVVVVQGEGVLTGVADSGVRAEAVDREVAKEVVGEAEGDVVKVVVVDSGADLVADSAAVADLAASVAG